ncbi:MAG: hypothetical protein SPK00_07765 [Corynebacterium glucuronolyticum]|nr:hypothetical protein [Corynebacterium glucuronolyticum]MDD7587209.1 hypothetical protein [Mycobacteriaceae bacterium]MDY5834628.1 hypothetical protein [Corynebacterium glucuronolyticum]
MPGPIPKRADKRRRRNKPAPGAEITRAPGAAKVKVPNVKPSWHPLMKEWYRSLKTSGQARFYQPSDWQTAQLMCHVMSLELNSGEPVRAATLSEFNKMATSLMTTEGERRRLRLELSASEPVISEDDSVVSIMEHYREKLS